MVEPAVINAREITSRFPSRKPGGRGPEYRSRATQMSLTESGSYFLGVANAISPPCSCSVPARGGKEWEIHPLPIATAHATVYGRNATPNGSRHTRGNVPGMIFPFSVSMRE